MGVSYFELLSGLKNSWVKFLALPLIWPRDCALQVHSWEEGVHMPVVQLGMQDSTDVESLSGGLKKEMISQPAGGAGQEQPSGHPEGRWDWYRVNTPG